MLNSLVVVKDEQEETPSSDSQLMGSKRLREQVAAWNSAWETIESCYKTIAETEKRLEDYFDTELRSIQVIQHVYSIDDYMFGKLKKDFELKIWGSLCANMNLDRIMSLKERNDLRRRLEGQGAPMGEVTLEAVLGFFNAQMQGAPSMMEAAVKEVYDFLRPRDSRKKTNSEFGVGDKVILENYLDAFYLPKIYIRYGWNRDNIDAMYRVFSMLEGKGFTGDNSAMWDALKDQPTGKKIVTEYFEFKGYKNGNLHVVFTKPHLVRELNRVAGGGNLRGDKVQGPRYDYSNIEIPKAADDNGVFFTPTPIQEMMLDRLELDELQGEATLLEPSAGDGRLVRAALCRAEGLDLRVTAVDNAYHEGFYALDDLENVHTVRRDFTQFQMNCRERYDRILMNPPFHGRADVIHAAMAFHLLKPGGVLVTILSQGGWFSKDHRSAEFRNICQLLGADFEVVTLPEDAFKESGTMVRTVMVKVRKK